MNKNYYKKNYVQLLKTLFNNTGTAFQNITHMQSLKNIFNKLKIKQ